MKKIKVSKALLATSLLSLAILTSCISVDPAPTSPVTVPTTTTGFTPETSTTGQIPGISTTTGTVTTTTEPEVLIPEENKQENGITINETVAYTEGAYAKWNVPSNASISDYSVFYTKDNTSYTPVDNELIRINNNEARVDILGLSAARYKIKIVNNKTSDYSITKTIDVIKDDRSGYAHFKNTTGVGAYKNDGTLKDNAIVVYVDDSNKNTVKATINGEEKVGLANILKAATNNDEAIDIRILGEIQTQQWNKMSHGTGKTASRQTSLDNAFASVDWEVTTENELKHPGTAKSDNYYKICEEDIISYGINSMSDDVNKGITKLDGLTNNVLKDIKATTDSKDQDGASHFEYDSYFNELDVRYGQNITVEGIGEDAKIFQWGFCFNQCNSVEVKNIEFSDYTEDAIGIQGANSDITKCSDYWIHNCTFNSGKNNWDVSCENDKKEGDGSTDFKSAHDLTISYCRYNGTHKTALVGSGSSSYQYNVTFHHNFYNQCGSRLPFTRNSNFHIYNCYYYGSTGTNMQIDNTAYAFIEGCHFENTNKTFTTSGGTIKLYNNIIDSTSSVTGSSIYYAERTDHVTNTCKADKVTDYSSFDTDKNLFYYDDTNNISKVDLMLKPDEVKTYIPTVAGAGLLATIDYSKNHTEKNDPYVDTKETAKYSYSSEAPTEAGIYYTVLDNSSPQVPTQESALANSTIVRIDGDNIMVTDTNDSATTIGYYIFDDTKKFTSESHTYNLSITLEGVGNNWYFLRFLDANGDALIVGTSAKTGSNKTGFIAYQYKGNTVEFATSAFATRTTYNFKLEVNYDTNKATLSVGDNTIQIDDFDTQITGFKFFTAKTATDRSFTVSKITIE